MKEISFFMKCVFLCRIYPLVVALDYSLLEKVSRVSRVSREEKRFILCKNFCQKSIFALIGRVLQYLAIGTLIA